MYNWFKHTECKSYSPGKSNETTSRANSVDILANPKHYKWKIHSFIWAFYPLTYITVSRWEVIANYMNIHSSSGVKRTAKDVIGKAKSLQKLGEQINLLH